MVVDILTILNVKVDGTMSDKQVIDLLRDRVPDPRGKRRITRDSRRQFSVLYDIDQSIGTCYGIIPLFNEWNGKNEKNIAPACVICDDLSKFIHARIVEISNPAETSNLAEISNNCKEKRNRRSYLDESSALMQTVESIKSDLGTKDFGQKLGYLLAYAVVI